MREGGSKAPPINSCCENKDQNKRREQSSLAMAIMKKTDMRGGCCEKDK
jgi:hypothetical protein